VDPEPEDSFSLREEWVAVLFIAIIVLTCVGAGIMLLLGL
jgi:hypothetical protein